MDAAFDLYAILSFEPLHLSEVQRRVQHSKSEHLKRYFSSKFFRNIIRSKRETELGDDFNPEELHDEMLLYLLESMRDTKEVEMTSDTSTLEWLMANHHRLYMIPADELEDMFRIAREVEGAPEHTGKPDCVLMRKVLLFSAWYEEHAVRFDEVPTTELRYWAEVALDIGTAPESPTDPDCERCLKELELDVVTFVRKLPQGRKRRRRVPLKKLSPAFLRS